MYGCGLVCSCWVCCVICSFVDFDVLLKKMFVFGNCVVCGELYCCYEYSVVVVKVFGMFVFL